MTDTNPLANVEAEHGFIFGNPDGQTAAGPMIAALVCVNPICQNRGEHIAVTADTVLPIHCGCCFTELMPNPEATPDISRPIL